MANQNRVPDDNDDPLLRPASPGEPTDSAEARQRENWRERYPGWETFEGKPNDPRFMSSTDPNADPRYNTDLKNQSTLPGRAGAALWVWLLFVGLVLMTLFGLAMYIHFQKPSPRSPDTQLHHVGPIRPVSVAVADSMLPLRTRHHQPR